MVDYDEFLDRKIHSGLNHGPNPTFIPDYLFPFQKHLTEWAIKKGRGALFEDCGLGKTVQELVWSENIVRHTNKPVLILTPLAVSHQFLSEAEKFDLECHRSKDGKLHKGINVTNYERLNYFNPNDFSAVVCDESSILKNFDGVRRSEITNFMKKVKYRLLATATAAPNDYTELGTSSEALGDLGHIDMLNRFFKNEQSNTSLRRHYGETVKWRLKGHAETPFWRWVCSWSRSCRVPSDLGFEDGDFILPELGEKVHTVKNIKPLDGNLFNLPAIGWKEQREERRRTIDDRCQKVADLVSNTGKPALIWCHLNKEGDTLEKLIPDGIQISGRDSDESKESKFIDFTNGNIRALITKPKIGAWGLNFQHCAHIVLFPSHSYEQFYQGVRRCWRFGQKENVHVDIVTTEGEKAVLRNLQRKSEAAKTMFSNLVREMNNVLKINPSVAFTKKEEIPAWL